MQHIKLEYPGLRIFKTALAVGICLVISYLIGYKSPFYAAISCVLMMKSTPDHSFRSGKERMQGTLLGGFIAGSFLLLKNMTPLVGYSWVDVMIIPAVLVVDLWLCKEFKLPEYASSMSCVLVLVIWINHGTVPSETFVYIIYRIIETLAGITIAVLVNYYIRPLKKNKS